MVLDGNAVRSVDRAAALLLALGDSQGEAGVTELARRLNFGSLGGFGVCILSGRLIGG